jgi:hypothetical protein
MSAWPEVATYPTLTSELVELWENGLPGGDKTGWPSLDQALQRRAGAVDDRHRLAGFREIRVGRCARRQPDPPGLAHGVLFALRTSRSSCTPRRSSRKVIGKPFGKGPTERMTKRDIHEVGIDVLRTRVAFVTAPDDGARTATKRDRSGMALAGQHARQKRGLVIDPMERARALAPARAFGDRVHLAAALPRAQLGAHERDPRLDRGAPAEDAPRERRQAAHSAAGHDRRQPALVEQGRCAVTVWRDMEMPRVPGGRCAHAEGPLQARRPAWCGGVAVRPRDGPLHGAAAEMRGVIG